MAGNKPSYIKDQHHVDLDTVLSRLRIEQFYGKLEIMYENGKPTRCVMSRSVKLGESLEQEKVNLPIDKK